MTNIIILDETYSTTRLVVKEKPEIINNPEDKFESVLFLPMGEGRKGEGGLRTKGYFKKSYEDKPLISIITVVYNGEKYLEETIQSVINQTYENVEYIIIDGGSTDGTFDIIKKYEDQIDYWVSEKDKGIYDAMNKGIDIASGEWINFMNAGDWFYANDVLKTVFNNLNFQNIDVMYGDTLFKYQNYFKQKNNIKLKYFWLEMPFSHQSTFISTKIHKRYKYDLKQSIAADFKLFYLMYIEHKSFKYIENIISIMEPNGLSDVHRIKSIINRYKIVKEIDFRFYYMIFYFFKIVKEYIKKVIPYKIINLIRKKT